MRFAPVLAGLFIVWQAGLALAQEGCPQCFQCSAPAQVKVPCPPPYIHYYEDAPKLKFKRACPRPVCDPCHLEHFGYYQPCWHPWPFGEDWSHCPYQTSAQALPLPQVPPYAPRIGVAPGPKDPRLTPKDKGKGIPVDPMDGMKLPKLPEPKPLDESSYNTVPETVKRTTGPRIRVSAVE
jgi:hypothetical protein